MSEAGARLVTWDAPENLGMVGNKWVCPVDGVDRLVLFEMGGGTVTDEVIYNMAGGRQQHLEKVRYPEGYHAVRIVDSETGEIQEAPARQYRYAGYKTFDCDCGIQHPTPITAAPITSKESLDVGGGHQITSVANYGSGLQTLIQAVPISAPANDYYNRKYTSAALQPKTQAFGIYAYCRAGDFAGHVNVNITDRAGQTEAHVMLHAEDHGLAGGDIQLQLSALQLSAAGEPVAITSINPGVLFDALGLDSLSLTHTRSRRTGEVSDPSQKDIAIQGVAEILGMGSWKNLDLRMTASGLYAAMGQLKPNFNDILVTQD